jgi:hypothetical protein
VSSLCHLPQSRWTRNKTPCVVFIAASLSGASLSLLRSFVWSCSHGSEVSIGKLISLHQNEEERSQRVGLEGKNGRVNTSSEPSAHLLRRSGGSTAVIECLCTDWPSIDQLRQRVADPSTGTSRSVPSSRSKVTRIPEQHEKQCVSKMH